VQRGLCIDLQARDVRTDVSCPTISTVLFVSDSVVESSDNILILGVIRDKSEIKQITNRLSFEDVIVQYL